MLLMVSRGLHLLKNISDICGVRHSIILSLQIKRKEDIMDNLKCEPYDYYKRSEPKVHAVKNGEISILEGYLVPHMLACGAVAELGDGSHWSVTKEDVTCKKCIKSVM